MRGKTLDRYRIAALAAMVGLLPSLGACVQMPRHSNTLFFATSTTIGLSADLRATSDPSVTLGYERREGVVMPLLANLESKSFLAGAVERMTPCGDVSEDAGSSVSDSCLFRGNKDKDFDTYSVLATFGGKLEANAGSGNAKTSAGIAQYFATGLAARSLAEKGGAALVAVGPAAQESAVRAYIDSPEGGASILAGQTRKENALGRIRLGVSNWDDAKIKSFMADQAKKILTGDAVESFCSVKSECLRSAELVKSPWITTNLEKLAASIEVENAKPPT